MRKKNKKNFQKQMLDIKDTPETPNFSSSDSEIDNKVKLEGPDEEILGPNQT